MYQTYRCLILLYLGDKKDGTIAINYLPTEEILADRLTKALTPTKMKIFIK